MKNTSLFLPLVFFACTSGVDAAAEGEGPSGLVSSRTVASLSDDEVARLCEWSLQTQGGAGKMFPCGSGRSVGVPTRDQCIERTKVVRGLAPCYATTVAEAEQCAIEVGNDACGESPTCDAANDRLEKCTGD